jgi:hypothetical protein
LYKLARAYEDEDSSDESGSSDSDDEDDGDSSDEERIIKKKRTKSSIVQSKAPSIGKTNGFETALLTMIERQNAILDSQSQPQSLSQRQPQSQGRMPSRLSCYNCKGVDHVERNCPRPCKYCHQMDHRRYSCPQKPSRLNNNNAPIQISPAIPVGNIPNNQGTAPSYNNQQSTNNYFMSLSSDICENVSGNSIEAILAMKRLHEEQDDGPEQKKRDVYNEHGVDINDETISNETITSESATSTSNETIIDSPDITTSTEGSTASSSSEPNVNQSGQVIEDAPLTVVYRSKPATVVRQLRKQKVFQLSCDEIVALSSKAHTEFRRPLESPSTYNTQIMDTADMLLHATTDITLPQGNYAPRIIGKVNGIATHLILDTGCTPCVISFHKVLKLGLANQLVHNAQSQKGNMMVGDGSKVPCKGLIQGFKVEILPEHSIKVDALVLDVPETAYEFLFGRIAMAKIGIHADLGRSRWFVSDGFSNKPLEVFYTDPYATNDKC